MSSTPSTSSRTILSQDASQSIVMDTGYQDFKDVRKLPAFVDKTLLINDLLGNVSRMLLTAPRRFGKSVNISMIKRFFEIMPDKEGQEENQKLFENTLIEDYPEIINQHFGKYPVIFLDFKSSVSIISYEDAFESIRNIVHKAYKAHSYLGSSGKLNVSQKRVVENWINDEKFEKLAKTSKQIEVGLENLSEYLVKHHGVKVIVMVDEYDAVCSDAIIHIKDDIEKKFKAEVEIEKIINLCVGTLSCLLKGNDNVVRGILTGISYLATMGLSKLNNVIAYKFQEDNVFSKYYGLTLDELEKLLKKFDKESQLSVVLRHYNGYRGDILSIWSVMRFLNEGRSVPHNYWKESGIAYNLYPALEITSVSSHISKLLSKMYNVIEIDIIEKITYHDISKLKCVLDRPYPELQNVNVFFTFLLEQGYFSVNEVDEVNGKMKIMIPNDEIRKEFSEQFLKFYVETYNISTELIKECASKFDDICSSDNEKNEQTLRDICHLLNEIIDPSKINSKNEATLHHIIFIIIFHCLHFKCYSEVRANRKNKKRLDLLMLQEKLGIIIEIKNEKSPEEGLFQIKKNNYCDAFKNPSYNPDEYCVEYYILIGLSMSM